MPHPLRIVITRALMVGVALALGACEDPPQAPTSASGPASMPTATALPVAVKLEIGGLVLQSRTFTAGEHFPVEFKAVQNGSGTLKAYGLKTRLGQQVYPFTRAIPVITGGQVMLSTVGPLPNQSEAGAFDLEFWVIDDAGVESNHLQTRVTVN